MDKIECPYCGEKNIVERDGEYGSAQDTAHEMECESCGKNFVFRTEISFDYYASKADCLNGSPHQWRKWSRVCDTDKGNEFQIRLCKDCGMKEERVLRLR